MRESMYRGKVVSGRGLAVPAMSESTTQRAIAQMTGLKIVPGTLNVRMDKPFDGSLPIYVSLKELGRGMPDIPNRKGLRFGPVKIAGRFAGFAFQGDEPEYSPFNLELFSDHRLRKELSLSDGDYVEFELGE